MLSEVGGVFHAFTKIITEFGPYVFGLVSLLIVIIFLFFVVIYLLRSFTPNKNDNQDISLLIKDAVHSELSHINLDESKNTKEKNLMEIFLRINNSLKYTVRELVPVIDADRVAFYLFHNGTHSLNGVPFLKASCVCEMDKSGLATYHLVKAHKDMPISLLDDLVTTLIKKHDFVTYKNKNKLDVVISKLFFDEQDKTCIFSGIFEMDSSELLGFIVAEYDFVEEFSNEDLKYKINKLRETAKHTSATMQIISALK